MGKPSVGQLQHHKPSKMTAPQAQDYCDLVIAKAAQLGEQYVARQLAWGAAELDRLQLHQVRPNGPFVIQAAEVGQ
jgi:hypothetical protein